MTELQFKTTYPSLPKADQVRFLSFLAAQLTVLARGTYLPSSEDVAEPAQLREFNEFVHRVTSHLFSLLSNASDRYPDDVLAEVLWDFAIALKADGLITHAMDLVRPGLGATVASVA